MAGRIPQPFIDDLLAQTDIAELIDSYVPLKKHGNSYTACCPFHNEKTPSFNVVPKKQFYHCFGCGESGNAISFIMRHLNQPFIDALETLASRAGMAVPRDNNTKSQNSNPSLYALLTKIEQYYQNELKQSVAMQYLQQRNISETVIERFKLGFAPPGWHSLENKFKSNKKELITAGMLIAKEDGNTYDRYRNRLMFPIHNRLGKIVGFGGRTLDDSQKPKYLNSPETTLFQKSRELYGLYQLLSSQGDNRSIIIVEGYMDVLALAEYGVNNAVATLGTATSSYHIQLLCKYTNHLIFCFDGDLAGKQAALKALEASIVHLSEGIAIDFMFLPEGEDPDTLVQQSGKDGFLKYMAEAKSLNQLLLEQLTIDLDITRVAGKTKLIQRMQPYLQKIQQGAYKQLLIDELALITRIPSDRIEQWEAPSNQQIVSSNTRQISRTPVRIAIALLIQYPERITPCLDLIDLNALNYAEFEILRDLIIQLQKKPNANTATLIESWRQSDYFTTLNALATWDTQVPQHALTEEFLETIRFLSKKSQAQPIEFLLNKSRTRGLTPEERQQLKLLLEQKHQKQD